MRDPGLARVERYRRDLLCLCVVHRPRAIQVSVLLQLLTLPLSKQICRIVFWSIVNLGGVIIAEWKQIRCTLILRRGHFWGPSRTALAAGMNVGDAAVEEPLSSVVIHPIERSQTAGLRAPERCPVQLLHRRRGWLRMNERLPPRLLLCHRAILRPRADNDNVRSWSPYSLAGPIVAPISSITSRRRAASR